MSTVEVHEVEGRHPVHKFMTVKELANIFHVPHHGFTRNTSKSATMDFWDSIVDDDVYG